MEFETKANIATLSGPEGDETYLRPGGRCVILSQISRDRYGGYFINPDSRSLVFHRDDLNPPPPDGTFPEPKEETTSLLVSARKILQGIFGRA